MPACPTTAFSTTTCVFLLRSFLAAPTGAKTSARCTTPAKAPLRRRWNLLLCGNRCSWSVYCRIPTTHPSHASTADSLGARAFPNRSHPSLCVRKWLLTNAQTGPFNRTSGQPSPKYLSMKERSETLRDLFPQGSSGNRLFSRLREAAVEMLNRERLDDEQMGFE